MVADEGCFDENNSANSQFVVKFPELYQVFIGTFNFKLNKSGMFVLEIVSSMVELHFSMVKGAKFNKRS